MARIPEIVLRDGESAEEPYEELDGESPAALDPSVVNAIGKALLAHYRDLTDAPLPDRFLVMLSELEAKEREHGK
jgi:hypothetical protein